MAANPASAAPTGGNFFATGHDMDFHCTFESLSGECEYFKIVVTKARNGSTLPILALDQGGATGEVPTALANIGATPVVTVDPTSAAFTTTKFVDASGKPLYSVIITASDSTCGGCDNTTAGEAKINARASDFTTYFNNGGNIIALTGADNFATYYKFVPLKGVNGTVVSPPFTVTAQHCTTIHIGYNYFPVGTVIHWHVNQTGTGTLQAGTTTTVAPSGKTMHFVDLTTSLKLKAGPHTHIYFSWNINGVNTKFVSTRGPACS